MQNPLNLVKHKQLQINFADITLRSSNGARPIAFIGVPLRATECGVYMSIKGRGYSSDFAEIAVNYLAV